jgi:hypothetical protein
LRTGDEDKINHRTNKLEYGNIKPIGIGEYWNNGMLGLGILVFTHDPIVSPFHYSFSVS